MDKKEAEDFVYKSYLKAEKYQDYNEKDAQKRRPELTKNIIKSKAGTPAAVVTGSKGKGSVSTMISQILQTTYKVGLMTGPHLRDFCERIKINGKKISDIEFVKYISMIQAEIDEIDCQIPKSACVSPMGIQTDLALLYFNSNSTDFNVFECGKGAKYDDVNNVVHEYAVINSIFLEHTRELGETLEEIAHDKACVIDGEQKCVYVAEQKPNVIKIITNRASKFKTRVKTYGRDFRAEKIRYTKSGMVFDVVIDDARFKDINIPLLGEHQTKNCALAMALSLDVLDDINIENVKARLVEIDWPGRMEILSSSPLIILDACINSASCTSVKDVMKQLNVEATTAIIGIPNDKDYAGVIREMNDVTNMIILTKSQNPHYVFSDEQCFKMRQEGIETVWSDTIEEALEIAIAKGDSIVILGTTSVISEVKDIQMNKGIPFNKMHY